MMAGGGRRSSSFRSRLSVINAIMWVVLLVWVYMLYSLSHPPAAPPFLHLLHNSSATYVWTRASRLRARALEVQSMTVRGRSGSLRV